MDAATNKDAKAAAGKGMPSLQLPKGGGAIRGIGEKFSVNPVTGTGTATIPIYATPGRADFYPKLSLSYDSGSGNGPYGIGWQLSLPAVTRKTDKGLPRYDGAGDSDTCLLSDSNGVNNEIKRHRPRTEGLFARIERWQRQSDGDIHWRATTRENVVNIYGRVPAPGLLIRPGDTIGTDASAANEQNRVNGNAPFTNAYLKRIRYGNQGPYGVYEAAADDGGDESLFNGS